MTTGSLAQLEHRQAVVCLRLEECRGEVVGTLSEIQRGMYAVAQVQMLGRILPKLTGPALFLAGLAGMWLLIRTRVRPRMWHTALFVWRCWRLWKEVTEPIGVPARRVSTSPRGHARAG